MPFEPQRIYEITSAFSAKQQTNMATVLADGDLDIVHPSIGTQIAQVSRNVRSDKEWVGKGHEFPTPVNRHEVTRDLRLQRTFDLSSLMAGWAAAFGMGVSAPTQPDAVNNSTCWQHVSTLLDPDDTKYVPVTTIYEQLVSGVSNFEQKLRGVAVNSFTISGRAGQVLQLQMDLVGCGERVADAVTIGDLTEVAFLEFGGVNLLLGPQGNTSDLSERLLEFSITVAQNLDLENARYPGTGLYAGRFWFGNRAVSLNFKLWLDRASSDMFDNWLTDELLEATLSMNGDAVKTGEPELHSCVVEFPSFRLAGAPIAEQNGQLLYDLTAGPEEIYKDADAGVTEPIQITVINEQASYLAMPA